MLCEPCSLPRRIGRAGLRRHSVRAWVEPHSRHFQASLEAIPQAHLSGIIQTSRACDAGSTPVGRTIQSHLWLANLEMSSGTTTTMSSTSKLPQQPRPDGPTMMTWNQIQHEQNALVRAHEEQKIKDNSSSSYRQPVKSLPAVGKRLSKSNCRKTNSFLLFLGGKAILRWKKFKLDRLWNSLLTRKDINGREFHHQEDKSKGIFQATETPKF